MLGRLRQEKKSAWNELGVATQTLLVGGKSEMAEGHPTLLSQHLVVLLYSFEMCMFLP